MLLLVSAFYARCLFHIPPAFIRYFPVARIPFSVFFLRVREVYNAFYLTLVLNPSLCG